VKINKFYFSIEYVKVNTFDFSIKYAKLKTFDFFMLIITSRNIYYNNVVSSNEIINTINCDNYDDF
jgi:hypothetical protein